MENAINIFKGRNNSYNFDVFKLSMLANSNSFNYTDFFTEILVRYNLIDDNRYQHLGGQSFLINNEEYFIHLINDTSREPSNKRVQKKGFLGALNSHRNLLGIYLIKNEVDAIDSFIFVRWTLDELTQYQGDTNPDGTTNPAAKVKVENIMNKLDSNNYPRVNSRIKYKSTILFPAELFI